MKVTYHKYWADKKFISIFLAEGLFKDKKSIQDKILNVLKVFELDVLSVKCDFFVEKDNDFLTELENIIGHKAETIAKNDEKKGLIFRQQEYTSKSIKFEGVKLNKVIELGIKYEEILGIECFDELNDVYIGIGLYDNDGSFINFNIEKYDVQTIKNKVNQIFFNKTEQQI